MAEPTLQEKIRADLTSARKERDKLRTTLITTFLAEIRNREIELGRAATDEEVHAAATSAIKRRRDAADQFRAAAREELAEKEEAEAALLQAYLPPQLGEDEVRAIVREAIAGGAADVGGVMKQVMPRAKGKFDGKELNRIVREELAAG
jgi:uncharacterized protein YqeY